MRCESSRSFVSDEEAEEEEIDPILKLWLENIDV